ncbi:Mitochondrial GTPase 1 [Aphis craccivora]|uniref:Mitochondrial GTPase 1 n=1 Tax=Aphis craccivora TaxID=307492 RepID=A0A6G0XRJ6_APHCR|nr:Mitochondrial GTPase 1 [Aphis craccivora]
MSSVLSDSPCIRIIPRKIRKKLKKTKKYSVMSLSQTEDTPDSITSAIKKKTSKLKNLLKLKKKSKPKIVDSKIKFNTVHEKFGERIQNNHVARENSTTD